MICGCWVFLSVSWVVVFGRERLGLRCSSCGWVWWFSCAYVDCSALGILGCVRWRSRISIVCCDRVFVRVGLLVL